MMRVLIANPSVGLGGAEFHTIELARHLSQCGAEVMHALERTRENESLFRTANNGISSLPLAWHRTAFPQEEALRQSRVLRKAVSSYSPDLLIIPLAYPDAAPGLLACAADLGLPTVVIFHLARKTINLTDLQLRAYARALQSANIHWVAVSPWLADTMSFLTGIPRSRITVIRNGAFQSDREVADLSDRDAVRAAVLDEFGIDPRDKVILTVARIDTQKNHLDLVTAADAVVRLRPDVKFVWLGEGPSTAIVDERIRELR
ncbi:MAG: glycosyltransferase, partial [Gammaproteobacteria bacterium]|nr:glycosyltransferase [Gammaproteobacteria bacterium]